MKTIKTSFAFAAIASIGQGQSTDCPSICANQDASQQKCSSEDCSVCPDCLCKGWCAGHSSPWEEKCNFVNCVGCLACFAPIIKCKSWCKTHAVAWSNKCNWDACSECDECTPQPTTVPAGTKKPNILLIFADDIGTGDIPGYWGNENTGLVDMPNLQELVNKGTTFKDAHSTPLCAPSRYTLLSGNYPHRGRNNWGTWGMGHPSQFVGNQTTIAQVLRDQAGYNTAVMGKWHVGGQIPSSNWWSTRENMLTHPNNDWTLPLVEGPQTFGFDSSLITDKGIQGQPYSFFRDGFLTTASEDVRMWEVGKYEMPLGLSEVIVKGEGDIGWDSTAYNMILVDETNRFLDDHQATRPNDPFFAYVALGAAHIPHSPPGTYIDGTPVAGQTPTKFLDILKELDLVVGSLVRSVEDRGMADSTIIIFTSDNGGLPTSQTSDSEKYGHKTGGPLLQGSKGSVYEGGHRVPFIMRYDGVFAANEERAHLIGINDIFSTLCEIAGVDIPSGSALDSVSFADYIVSNDTSGLRESLGIWSYRGSELRWKAIRRNNFKLVFDLLTNVTGLFDLDTDIGETVDLSSDSSKQSLVQMMFEELSSLGPH